MHSFKNSSNGSFTVGCESRHTPARRPVNASFEALHRFAPHLPDWLIQRARACMCVVPLRPVRGGIIPSLPSSLSVCPGRLHHSATPLQSSPPFLFVLSQRLRLTVWLPVFPTQISSHNNSTLSPLACTSPVSPAHPSHSPSSSLKTLCGWLCFVKSCRKFTLDEWSSSCSGDIWTWELLWQPGHAKRIFLN